jgi:galactitol-specific phosphotransferase system IIB component
MKKILLVAGTGIAVTIINRLENGLKTRGLENQYSITKCKVIEFVQKAPDFDIIIRTTMLTDEIDKPVINGLSLLIGGADAEAVLDEIAAAIKSQ